MSSYTSVPFKNSGSNISSVGSADICKRRSDGGSLSGSDTELTGGLNTKMDP